MCLISCVAFLPRPLVMFPSVFALAPVVNCVCHVINWSVYLSSAFSFVHHWVFVSQVCVFGKLPDIFALSKSLPLFLVCYLLSFFVLFESLLCCRTFLLVFGLPKTFCIF